MHPMTIRRRALAPLAFACALAVVPFAGAQEPAGAAPPPANRPVTSPGNAQWAATIDEARAQAAEQKKLVFYEFDSQNCGDCARMQSLLYPAFDFEALLIGMVPVRSTSPRTTASRLTELYGIKETPSVLIATPTGRLVFLMQGFKDARATSSDTCTRTSTAIGPSRRRSTPRMSPRSRRRRRTRSARPAATPGSTTPRPGLRYKRATVAPDATPDIRETRPSRAWRPPSSSSASPRRPERRSTSSWPGRRIPRRGSAPSSSGRTSRWCRTEPAEALVALQEVREGPPQLPVPRAGPRVHRASRSQPQ